MSATAKNSRLVVVQLPLTIAKKIEVLASNKLLTDGEYIGQLVTRHVTRRTRKRW